MKDHQITIRKIDPILRKKIVRNAKLSSQSINDWVLDAIRHRVGMSNSDNEVEQASWQSQAGLMGDDAFDEDTFKDFKR